ncbi:unnamed protein product [Arctogadus glacialis]
MHGKKSPCFRHSESLSRSEPDPDKIIHSPLLSPWSRRGLGKVVIRAELLCDLIEFLSHLFSSLTDQGVVDGTLELDCPCEQQKADTRTVYAVIVALLKVEEPCQDFWTKAVNGASSLNHDGQHDTDGRLRTTLPLTTAALPG